MYTSEESTNLTDKCTYLQSLIPLLQADNNSLPDLKFKSNIGDLSTSIQFLYQLMEVHLPPLAKQVNDLIVPDVVHQYIKLRNNPEYNKSFSAIDTLASKLGEKVTSVFQLLKTSIQPEVEDLQNQIYDKVKELSKTNPEFGLTTSLELSTDFQRINFDDIINNFGGIDLIKTEFSEVTGIPDPTLNMDTLRFGFNRTKLSIENVNIDEEATIDNINRIAEYLKNANISSETIRTVYDTVMTSYNFNGLIVKSLGYIFDTNDYATGLLRDIDLIKTYMPVVDAMQHVPFNLPDTLKDRIYTNIDTVRNAAALIRFAIAVLMVRFSDAVIITKDLLNDKTTEQYLSNGGSLEDISKFLLVFYRDTELPNTGIPISVLEEHKEQVNKEFTSLTATMMMNKASIRKNALTLATKDVLQEYLLNTSQDRLPDGTTGERFAYEKQYLIKKCINKLDGGDDDNLEGSLFKFIIDLWYDNTIVATVHNLFGEEIMKQLSISKEISDSQLSLVDARVAAKIMAKFIVDNLCSK